jgi:hypothetical protein
LNAIKPHLGHRPGGRLREISKLGLGRRLVDGKADGGAT